MSKDIEVGDYVKFLGSSNDSTWKAEYGLNDGDIVPVLNLDDDFVLVRTKTNAYIWVFLSQVVKYSCGKEDVTEIASGSCNSCHCFIKLPKQIIGQIIETGGIKIKDIIRYVFKYIRLQKNVNVTSKDKDSIR